ncbi:MAG: hypothetical protein H0W46_10055, partial [Acidimicrobiia bacterium]|nr:hypothetical protein [Acidimicrobiia bacterium]
ARRLGILAAAPALVGGGPARLLDDLAYGLGVWRGALAMRDVAALRPDLTPWPRGDDR